MSIARCEKVIKKKVWCHGRSIKTKVQMGTHHCGCDSWQMHYFHLYQQPWQKTKLLQTHPCQIRPVENKMKWQSRRMKSWGHKSHYTTKLTNTCTNRKHVKTWGRHDFQNVSEVHQKFCPEMKLISKMKWIYLLERTPILFLWSLLTY